MPNNHQQTPTPLSYTISDATKISGISRSGLYRLLAAGQLRAKKIGERTFVLHDSLKELIDGAPAWVPTTGRDV